MGSNPYELNAFYQFTSSFQPHWASGFTWILSEMRTTERNKNISGE
jgi:hypothetical protein